ncbi:interleukin-20-like [Rhinoraja longicauda]
MTGPIACLCLCLCLCLCRHVAAQPNTLHLGSCSLNVDLQEIGDHFSEIRDTIGEDTITGTRLLTDSLFHGIQAQESCCFLHHMLRFYVETVFRHHTPSSPLMERRTSSLANSFLRIKRDLRQCKSQLRCHCGEVSMSKAEEMHNTFQMLELRAAAVKAIGEVDSLIQWMSSFIASGARSTRM